MEILCYSKEKNEEEHNLSMILNCENLIEIRKNINIKGKFYDIYEYNNYILHLEVNKEEI